MIRIGTIVEYKGYTLTKKGRTFWTITKDTYWGYTTTLKNAKAIVDRRISKEA